MKDIKEKMKKLLMMSRDKSSPNEAAIAARRLRSMLDKHNMSESQITFGDLVKNVVNATNKNRVERWRNMLTISIAAYNDVIVKYDHVDGMYENRIMYMGHEMDVLSANQMTDFLVEAIEQWARIKKREFGFGRRETNQFKKGMAHELCKRLKEMTAKRKSELKNDGGYALVPLKMAPVIAEFGGQRIHQTSDRASFTDLAARAVGSNVAGSLQLGKQIDKTQQKRIG